MSVAYNRANVKLIGTHAGVAIGEDGHSQMGLEDIGTVRSLPNMRVFQPADDVETKAIMKHVVETEGPCYIRLTRQKLPTIHDDSYKFVEGKWHKMTAGKNIALIGTGPLVWECMEANKKCGNKYTVVNAASVKPLDQNMLRELVQTHDWIVTAED